MTDKEALDIIAKTKIEDIDAWSEAVYIAAKRLEECQWHDYDEEDFALNYWLAFLSKVILGVRYDDGSRGTVDGHVMYSMEKGYYLSIDHDCRSPYTDKAVIEKWMRYPRYDG